MNTIKTILCICAVAITLSVVYLTFSVSGYLDGTVEAQNKAAENGRYEPHDVRDDHYGWEGGSVDGSGLRRIFDTRTGRQYYWNGNPVEDDQKTPPK